SRVNIDIALRWYNKCIQEHHQCAIKDVKHAPMPILPTRVIDVGHQGQNPVLYEPTEERAAEYVALSHCWGGAKPMKLGGNAGGRTLLLNLLSCCVGGEPTKSRPKNGKYISLPPLSAWPKTFRDAVEIVRGFDLRYIWIDNVCILQGNPADWAKESERMAAYFGNATFTIAAVGASSDSEGCFFRRMPFFTRPLRLVPVSEDANESYQGFYVHVTGPVSRTVDADESYHAPLDRIGAAVRLRRSSSLLDIAFYYLPPASPNGS
ncbi:hypothetical protein H2201_009157, partial [Coniosporium apollinis]